MWLTSGPQEREKSGLESGLVNSVPYVCLGFYHTILQTGHLINSRNFLLTVLEAGSLRSGVNRVRWGPASGLRLLPVSSRRGRGWGSLSFIRALVPFTRLQPHDLSSSQRPHLLLPSSLGVRRIWTYELWEDTHIQAIAVSFCFWKDSGAEEPFYKCNFVCLFAFLKKLGNCMNTPEKLKSADSS